MKKLAYAFALFFALFFALLQPLSAQNKLNIINPQWWGNWPEDKGTIEEAVYTLKPQGLYVEVGLYLTLSWPENPYGITDSMEIVFDFTLPEEAIVTDSWLWVDDVIVHADVWEVWTALQTYEEIVDRQQDPSVLYENPEGGHQLRIFPLVTQESRKVKITYLLPARWTEEEVIATLPTEFLNTSKTFVNNFRVLISPDPAWQNYRFEELPGLTFQTITLPIYGTCLEGVIPSNHWGKPLHFVMDTPTLSDGLFVGRHSGSAGNVYEIAYFPQTLPATEKTSHLMVAVQYSPNNSNLTFEELLESLRTHLKAELDDGDFFNLAIGNSATIFTASQNWIPADDASIDFVFDSFNPVQGGALNPLIDLLVTAGNLIVDNGPEGEMLLVSNTDQYYSHWYANPAIETFFTAFPDAFPVHICDFQSQNFAEYWPNWWEEEPAYYGNELFNTTLTTLTGGTYFNLREGGSDFTFNLTLQLANHIDGVRLLYDLDTDLDNGFCYQRYPVNYLGQSEYAHLPILQVGRYEGDFPMTMEFFALVDGQVVTDVITISENEVVELDTLAQKAWVGNFFHAIESNDNDPNMISQIVDMSIQNRVLSKYTAFIALDPNIEIEPCYTCPFGNPGPILIPTEEQPIETGAVHAFPNPFSNEVVIQLEGFSGEQVRIFDQMGRLVRILEPAHSLSWDGRNGEGVIMPPGLYIIIVIDEEGNSYEVKVMKGA